MCFHSHFRSEDCKTTHQGDLHYKKKCFSLVSFSLFLLLFWECSKTKYDIKYKINENYIQILPLFYSPTIDFLCKQLQIMRYHTFKLVSKFANVNIFTLFLQSLGNRDPTLFGLGQLKEFLDVTPIVLQMCWASHRCSVNRAQKMLHWCTFAPVLSARRCSVNVALFI